MSSKETAPPELDDTMVVGTFAAAPTASMRSADVSNGEGGTLTAHEPTVQEPTEHEPAARPEDALVAVRFEYASGEAVESVHVVGEFNGWSTEATPMERVDGQMFATVLLTPGRRYSYLFLVDGHRWQMDPSSSASVPNDFGGHDSVLDLASSNGALS